MIAPVSWPELLNLLLETLPDLAAGLRPAPPADALDRLEMEVGVTLAPSVREVLERHDGQYPGGRVLFGLVLMGTGAILQVWRQEPSPVEWPAEDPDPRLRAREADRRFLPLFTDDTGNFLGVDLDPAPLGTPFQVVVFGADIDDPRVVAPDLGTLFAELAAEVRRGHVDPREEHGFPVLRLRRAADTGLALLLP